jgi:AmmeMemoRadiSam system protein A
VRFVFGAIAVFFIWYFFVRPDTFTLSLEAQAQLLSLARRQLATSVSGDDLITVDASEISDPLLQNGAAFVSLEVDDALRGCMIDAFEPHEPLYVNVIHNTQLAARADERFAALRVDELERTAITISVVYNIESVGFSSPDALIDKLEPFVDGVILTLDGTDATYLATVWETFPDPEEFLSQLCIKAGWDADRWRTEPYPEVRTYAVLSFGESEPASTD